MKIIKTTKSLTSVSEEKFHFESLMGSRADVETDNGKKLYGIKILKVVNNEKEQYLDVVILHNSHRSKIKFDKIKKLTLLNNTVTYTV